MKVKIITICILLMGLNTFAQKLTPKEAAAFNDIAYSYTSLNKNMVVLKWVTPIRYKVYGEMADYLIKEIDTTLNQLKKLTQLDIQRTDDDDEANFIIVIGKEEKDLLMLSNGIKKYLNPYGAFYFNSNNKYEIYRAENLIIPENYDGKGAVRYTIKKNLVKSLGFLKDTDAAPSSLFYSGNNNKLKIDPFDSHIISTFYLENIKPGMTKTQVDETLMKLSTP